MSKSNSKFLRVTREGQRSKFTLGNGFVLQADLKELPDAMQEECMRVGFEDKMRDSCASLSKDQDYAAAEANLTSIWEGLLRGEWNRRAGTGLGFRIEDIITGLAEYKDITYDQADGTIRNAPAEKVKLAIKKDPKFAAAVAKATAARLDRMADKGVEEDSRAVDELFA